MSENPAASEWAAARGERWSEHLAGMEAMLAPINEPLLEALRLDASSRVADIGSGGGATSIEIARRMPAGSVHGFDISATLVDAARARTKNDARPPVFQVADMATALPEQPYDRLVSRLGIMFFADEKAAFSNIARWLAPGRRFAFAVWGPVSENVWQSTVREVVGRVVDVPAPDLDGPGPFRYSDASKLVALLGGAGFVDVQVAGWRGTIPMGSGRSPAESASFALSAFQPFAELLAKKGGDASSEARAALAEAFAKHQEAGAVRLPACLHIVTGSAVA